MILQERTLAGPSLNDMTKQVQDLTNKLGQLSNEPSDFRYSDEFVTSSQDQITQFLVSLKLAKGLLGDLDTYGDVGQFPSALATRNNLVEDVRGIRDLLDHHIAYLGSLQHAIEAVGHNFRSADEAGSQ